MPGAGVAVTELKPATSGSGPAPGKLVTFLRDCTAGTVGGIVVVLVGHPFDTVKVRLQTQSSANPVYAGVSDCVSKTWKSEGIRGLYKGMSSPIAGQMFFRAIHFSAEGQARNLYSGTEADGSPHVLTTAELFKSGGIAGFFAALAEGPIDLYKSQLQVQSVKASQDPTYKAPYTTLGGVIRHSFHHNGIRGPFQGLAITIVRDIPANAAFFGSFEVIKRELAKRQGVQTTELGMSSLMFAGGIAGSLFWIATFPLDCIKSAIQGDSMIPSERKFTGIVQTAKALWADGGVPRFFRGFLPCMMRAVPANAAMLTTVSTVQAQLAKATG